MKDPRCQSPIESKLLAALIVASTDQFDTCELLPNDAGKHGRILWGDLEQSHQFCIRPQERFGRYRVDFAVFGAFFDFKTYKNRLGMVLVECDGHDFHERTKEQAARDRSRDRALLEAGHKVIRFTGSEIWRDPASCAMQTIRILTQDMGAA